MPAPFVNLNNFFTAVVALGVMLLLRRLGFSTGSGGDEDKDGDSAEVETERSGDEKGMGEEMVGEKTGL